MASVKVAVRVRPFNQREKDMSANLIVQMEGKKTRLLTVKNSKEMNDGNREKYKDFTFDHSYWSYDNSDQHYASQEQVFSDLGIDVIDSAFEGYNACVFAYGQTGSGKTFTMMGSPENQGLIPRICRQLFSRVAAGKESGSSFRTEVSYLEIYNERVKDLLATDSGHSLRVREHPRLGPYVQDLSKHLVSDYNDIHECMHRGNLQRTTASTQMNDVSSRSHAIFTLTFVQASYRHNNLPQETVSKVHLVDLAGSERADATGATGQRLVEGAHINKSLVTLGSVISALAESSQTNDKTLSKGVKKNVFIPYRDSVLTWLLKDSLGGNSKTIMIAAISPADCNYGETLSTLRYANRAKNIINKPTINEDPNVKLIRELREEIDNLRAQIHHHTDPIQIESGMLATLHRKEAQEKVLTEKWTEKWRETQQILQEQKTLGLRKSGLGVVLDSDMPHLVGIDDNLLSTGVTLYHLKEGETVIGSSEEEPLPDIIVRGPDVLPLHCRIILQQGQALLQPAPHAACWLNTVLLDHHQPYRLTQGCILLLGRTNMFRYNDPAEAAKLRQEGAPVNLSRLSLLSWSTTDLRASEENLASTQDESESETSTVRIECALVELEKERQELLQQQEERQRRWNLERQELLQAQKELLQEREAMERSYAAACRKLSGSWHALEKGWSTRRRALRARSDQLSQRVAAVAREQGVRTQEVEKGEGQVTSLRRQLEEKRAKFQEFLKREVEGLEAKGIRLPDLIGDSPTCSYSTEECLMRLLERCPVETADTIQEGVERHKKELDSLEEELQSRVTSVANHKVALAQLEVELTRLDARGRGLMRALRDGVGPDDTEISPIEGVKRSKSELVLRSTPKEEILDPLSADEREEFRRKKLSLSLSLSLDPLTTPTSLPTDESFHTAPCTPKTFSPKVASPNEMDSPNHFTPINNKPVTPQFKLGPNVDDSDDMSSTEDYHKPRIVEGQSSSSIERSPEERHQKAKFRRRISTDSKGRRQVTEAEALRAMQRLCSRIANQKMLVISSLENDCSKEELNRQIAVLQDLQKKYVRLEMALQYSFFERPPRRAMMVTPIQETPSLTLSESDMVLTTDPNPRDMQHPNTDRLKDEIEASDNISTSNDECPSSQELWDPLRRRSSSDSISDHHDNRVIVLASPEPIISEGLHHPINFDRVVSVVGWVTRGAGARTHIEYEVVLELGGGVVGGVGGVAGGRVSLLRRYRRFRDFYLAMKRQFGNKMDGIQFPSRTLWSSHSVARYRRPLLEQFLRRTLALAHSDPACSLRAAPLTHHTLAQFSPFFRKGVFESGKCGTG